jgi:hypothetical protein
MSQSLKRAIRSLVPEFILEQRKARRHKKLFGDADYKTAFQIVHDQNLWENPESKSGGGSTVEFTKFIREDFSKWLHDNGVTSMVDLPCGDFNWMRLVDFPAGMTYHGIDIVPDLIAANSQQYQNDHVQFSVGDIIAGPVPAANAYFCRDVFIHFPNDAVEKSIANVRVAGAKWLIATTFPDVKSKVDTVFPNSRKQNMALFLGEPDAMLEDFGDGMTDKFMGVWRLS